MSFGSRLRERRDALGMTQTELGRLLGVTGSAIANYENGFSSPKADVLYKVFDALQCDANYLFQDEMSDEIDSKEYKRERSLLALFRRMNEEGQEKLIDNADDLVRSGKYIKNYETILGNEA